MLANTTHVAGIESHQINFTFNVGLSLFAGYLFIALVFYEYSLTYWKHPGRQTTNQNKQSKSRILRLLCIAGAKISFLHSVTETASPFVQEGDTCYALGIMWLLTYAVGLLITYVFLWQRQRWLYASPPLKYLLTRNIKILSWSTLMFLILSAVSVFLAGSRMIFFSSCGENADQTKHQFYTITLSVILVCLTVIGQIQILILFCIPMLAHERRARKSLRRPSSPISPGSSGDKSEDQRPSREHGGHNKNINALVKKCALLACICMIIDISAAITTVASTVSAGKVIYDLNIFISVVCCVLSFHEAGQMLFPFYRTRKNWAEKFDTTRALVTSQGSEPGTEMLDMQ